MENQILQVKDLYVHFHTGEGLVRAVNGITYSLNYGETLAVVGESGCGKSASVMAILGLLPIPPAEVSGSIVYKDIDLLRIPSSRLRRIRGKEISMIFQDPMTSLNPVLTVGYQITEILTKRLGLKAKKARNQAIELMYLVGIPNASDRLNNYPFQFSGGMRQRIMITIALACNPSILIADEPTTALDVTIQAQIMELVKDLRDRLGMSLIWITHDLGVVAGLADRVIVMYAGHILEEAKVEELYANPLHPYTLALLNCVASREGNEVGSIEGSPPNLLTPTPGCPFAPRCSYVIDTCKQQMPDLLYVGKDHKVACWVNIRNGRPEK
jgi:oligopeptide transport system ATP-binding protein